MKDKVCPACGADTLTLRKEVQVLKESFGGQKKVPVNEYYCSTCESTGDFFNENEDIIETNLKLLKKQSIRNILNDFSKVKISMSAIERALSLPQRTLTKWKNGDTNPSSTGLALMKYLRIFPWLLEVAENNFDYNSAQKIHIKDAVRMFLNSAKFDSRDFTETGITSTPQSTFIFIETDIPRDNSRLPDDNQVKMLEVDSQVLTTTE